MAESANAERSSARTALFALASFAAFRLPSLVRLPPWTDEIFTMQSVVGQSFRHMVASQADDQTNPPLFYLLLWLWRAIGGDALWWLRLLPALCGILIALPVLAICRRARLGYEATALAVALTAVSQSLIYHSNELRNYALYALLAAWSLALWLRLREGGARRDLWLLTAVNVALVNTHYFGGLVVAAQWLDAAVWARGRARAMTRSAAMTAASLLPWIGMVVRRSRRSGDVLTNANWIPHPRVGDLFDPYRWTLGRSPWLAVDLALLVALGAALLPYILRRRRAHPAIVPIALVAFVPAIVAMSVSLLSSQSVWVSRYLLATAVPFLVLSAAAVTDLLPVRWRAAGLAFACWPAALSVAAFAGGAEKVRYDLLADRIVAASPRGRADVYTSDWVEGGPLTYQARRFPGTLRVAYTPAADSVTASDGWFLWSEQHPPAGLPPVVSLRRHGYRTGTGLSVVGMWDDLTGRTDSVVAVPFHRDSP